MTICLGVLTPDSLIIAADTEETDGFMKTNQSKIAYASNIHIFSPVPRKLRKGATRETATCAVAGAGNAGYLDTISPALMEDFQEALAAGEDALLSEFRKNVKQFYQEHVIPFAAYPPMERPDFSVLIGVSRKGERNNLLYVSEKTAVRQTAPFAAVGAGATYAMLLLKRLWPQAWIDRKTAALIVAFIMFHVKESVENCGKFTDIAVLYDGQRRYMPWQMGRDLETMFHRNWRIERDAIHALFSMSPRHQQQSVAFVGEQFRAFREDIEKLTKGLIFEDIE